MLFSSNVCGFVFSTVRLQALEKSNSSCWSWTLVLLFKANWSKTFIAPTVGFRQYSRNNNLGAMKRTFRGNFIVAVYWMKNAEGGMKGRTVRCHKNSFNKTQLHILAVKDVSEVGVKPWLRGLLPHWWTCTYAVVWRAPSDMQHLRSMHFLLLADQSEWLIVCRCTCLSSWCSPSELPRLTANSPST